MTGPYYASSDYAGLFRRFAIILIDLGVVLLAAGAIVTVFRAATEDPDEFAQSQFWTCAAFCFAYLVVLEASPVGTLGFRLTGVKIVTLQGTRPSILRMTFRLLLWILGPINAFLDLYWLTGDEYRQTLRDKLAGTVVIRRNAVPLGTGDIQLNRYQLMGQSFVFYEVRKPKEIGR